MSQPGERSLAVRTVIAALGSTQPLSPGRPVGHPHRCASRGNGSSAQGHEGRPSKLAVSPHSGPCWLRSCDSHLVYFAKIRASTKEDERRGRARAGSARALGETARGSTQSRHGRTLASAIDDAKWPKGTVKRTSSLTFHGFKGRSLNVELQVWIAQPLARYPSTLVQAQPLSPPR